MLIIYCQILTYDMHPSAEWIYPSFIFLVLPYLHSYTTIILHKLPLLLYLYLARLNVLDYYFYDITFYTHGQISHTIKNQ